MKSPHEEYAARRRAHKNRVGAGYAAALPGGFEAWGVELGREDARIEVSIDLGFAIALGALLGVLAWLRWPL